MICLPLIADSSRRQPIGKCVPECAGGAGQERGRGLLQWWENGAQVRDELASADHTYRNALISLCREAQ